MAKADALVAELGEIYGDKRALPRAKAQWRDVRNSATGSHLGFVGNLQVGALNLPPNNNPTMQKGGGGKFTAGTNGNLQSTAAILGGNYTDGAIAYRELRQSDNPYDPRFDVGTVTVGAVEPVKPVKDDEKARPKGNSPEDGADNH